MQSVRVLYLKEGPYKNMFVFIFAISLLNDITVVSTSPSRNQFQRIFRSPDWTNIMKRDAYSRIQNQQPNDFSEEVLDQRIEAIKFVQIRTNSGRVRGHKTVLENQSIKPVVKFLGIPYAAPPVGKFRWKKTEKPKPWDGVRNASTFGPICPQARNGPLPAALLPVWYRANHSLVQRMRMDEDCLYLNIYVPAKLYASERNSPNYYKNPLPVMVHFHGYTYAEGSGNFYDGSVLASYGEVIVVTFNYRLGVLGFMSTMESNSPGNYGLWDQVAALKWVSENIDRFGGDPNSVTVFGSGAGASCIGLLMVSVQLDAYFQRAILQSGTALAPWSMVRNPRQQTLGLARAPSVNCYRESSREMVECLKGKSWRDLINVAISTEPYDLAFSPVVDGQDMFLVDNPFNLMEKGEFLNYPVMIGVSPGDGFGYLRDRILYPSGKSFGSDLSTFLSTSTNYMKTSFDVVVAKFTDSFYDDSEVPLEAIEKLVRFIYTDWADRENPMRLKSSLMELYTDRQFVEPAVRTALHNTNYKNNAFFYTFYHHPGKDPNRSWIESALGEQDPFVFGAPLMGNSADTLFPYNYTKDDIMISTAVMTYWTNFAKNGDPGKGKKQQTRFITEKANCFENVVWPQYEEAGRQHLKISTSPEVGSHYRAQKVELWRSFLPSLSGVPEGRSSIGDGVNPLKPPRAEPPTISPGTKTPIWRPRNDTLTNHRSQPKPTTSETNGLSLQLNITLAVGFVLLFLNIIAFAVVSYHKEKDKYKIDKLKSELRMFKKNQKISENQKIMTSGHTTLESRLGSDPKAFSKSADSSPHKPFLPEIANGNPAKRQAEPMSLKFDPRVERRGSPIVNLSPRKGGDGAFAPKNGDCRADIAFLSPQKGGTSNDSERESVLNYWSRSECGDDSGASGTYNPMADAEKGKVAHSSTKWPPIIVSDYDRNQHIAGRCRSALPFCNRVEQDFSPAEFYAEPATLNRHMPSQRRIADIERYATAPRNQNSEFRQRPLEGFSRRHTMDYLRKEAAPLPEISKTIFEASPPTVHDSVASITKPSKTCVAVHTTSTGTYSSITTKL